MLIVYREKKELQNQELLVLERNEINHIKALRLKDNDEILVSDGEGKAYKSKLKYPDKLIINYKEIILEHKKQNVTICSAIPSGNRLEKMIDMAVQLGITNYIPVIYRYSERKDFSIERIKKIIRQASSQCGRLTLANIYAPIRFQDIFQYYKHKIMLFADKNPEHKISFNELVQIIKENDLVNIAIFIGPEAGFSKEEKQYLNQNFKGLILNENILRIETAVINVLSIFQFLKMNYQ